MMTIQRAPDGHGGEVLPARSFFIFLGLSSLRVDQTRSAGTGAALTEVLCNRFHQETLIAASVFLDFAFQLDSLAGFDIGGTGNKR